MPFQAKHQDHDLFPSGVNPTRTLIFCIQYFITAANGLAGYQMLLMMAKLSTGWTLSSSFSTLDPKQMKQINIGVIVVSGFEVCCQPLPKLTLDTVI